jgi:hypothetical protein
MVTKTQAIKNFLRHKARLELADLYHPAMEVQVMVKQGNGERTEGEYEGKRWTGWTDGLYVWKSFRIPYNAKSNPTYNDSEIKFDLSVHCEAIGLTGWDFVNKKSRYVSFDFDAIVGHKETHTAKLTDEQLKEICDFAINIPWVTVRKSTSGNGLHLYVFLDGVETANHIEHQAIGRSILGKMSALVGYDFDSKVDNCGGNIWIWHDKFEAAGGLLGPGLKLLKQGTILRDIPANWKDHIKVTSGSRKQSLPDFVETPETFTELCAQRAKVPLDVDHKRVIKFLEDHHQKDWWWDSDNWMLVCHTLDLQEAHKKLDLKGIFQTKSTGSSVQNCFCFPNRRGVWSVRRHTQGVQEADSWDQDGSGWTRCYFNREPDLTIASKLNGGAENDRGVFVFRETETAIQAAASLGAHVELPNFMMGRQAQLRPHKDGRLIFEIEHADTDNTEKMHGWIKTKRGGLWQKVLTIQTPPHYEQEVSSYEDIVRHLVVESGKDAGWVIKSDGNWCDERLEHIKCVLVALGVQKQDLITVLGSSILRRWTLVNRPFMDEYPGDRKWNRDAAQFAFAPSANTDSLKYDEWTQVLKHCGSGLDNEIKNHVWCKSNGLLCGGDYIKLWIAYMFQKPLEQLPYLFFYGPEGSGKSILHEAIELLVTRGVQRADAALISPSGFNGELEGAILCVVEETDLRQGKGAALNRIKDWVTSKSLPIHRKNGTPYTIPNSTHWLQDANDPGYCPVFPGDTRIVMAYVEAIEESKKITKVSLLSKLKKQAPDFLAAILNLDLPEPYERLNIPIIVTAEKKQAQTANRTILEEFLSDCAFPIDGECVKMSELHDKLIEWLPPSLVNEWSIIRFGREIVKMGFVKGRNMQHGSHFYIGNISLLDCQSTKPKVILEGDRLVWPR